MLFSNALSSNLLYLYFSEPKHSEREMKLWTELQSTHALLNSAKTEILQLQEEKKKFVDIVKEAAVSPHKIYFSIIYRMTK